MVKVMRFQKEHVRHIKQQDRDLVENADFAIEDYGSFEQLKHSYSIEVAGKIVACCGVVDLWNERGEAWALIDRDCKSHFLAVFKSMKTILKTVEIKRVEAAVRYDFSAGHKLVQLLGFELEARQMRKYGITGEDYSLYARVL